jgi:hypothetical protein
MEWHEIPTPRQLLDVLRRYLLHRQKHALSVRTGLNLYSVASMGIDHAEYSYFCHL